MRKFIKLSRLVRNEIFAMRMAGKLRETSKRDYRELFIILFT